MADARLQARAYTREVGDDLPEVKDWTWPWAPQTPTGATGPEPTTTVGQVD